MRGDAAWERPSDFYLPHAQYWASGNGAAPRHRAFRRVTSPWGLSGSLLGCQSPLGHHARPPWRLRTRSCPRFLGITSSPYCGPLAGLEGTRDPQRTLQGRFPRIFCAPGSRFLFSDSKLGTLVTPQVAREAGGSPNGPGCCDGARIMRIMGGSFPSLKLRSPGLLGNFGR